MMKPGLICVGAALLLGAGCARMPSISIPNPLDLVAGPSTIHLDVSPQPGALPLLRAGQSVSLAVADFTDARPGNPGRKIGNIRATVTNMHGTELSLDQDVNSLLQTVASKQLAADGFRLAGSGENAEFRLSVTTKAFSLNIAGTDDLTITADVIVREGKSGDVVWSGVVTERVDRYAGVSGNSRATITDYLGEGVLVFSGKISAVVRDSLAKAYPQSLTVSQQRPIASISGVSATKAATPKESYPAAGAGAATATVPAVAPSTAVVAVPKATALPEEKPAAQAVIATTGSLVLTSIPSRAKVYVGDVYYGLTPLTLDLSVGVSQMYFKLEGFKSASEKVSVRRGETTELEIKFQK